MKSSFFGFGLIAAVLTAIPFVLLWDRTDWHPYLIWLISLNGAAFVLYGLDKRKSRGGGRRAPKILLHLLAIAGGFAGAGLGRRVFDHKTNTERNLVFPVVIWLSAIAHGVLIYCLFVRRL